MSLVSVDMAVDTAEGVQQSLGPPSPIYQLTEKNLRIFKGEMYSTASTPSALKRKHSRSSNVQSGMETAPSQRSYSTTGYYRFKHLAAAGVYIHTDPRKDIQTAIESIIKAEIPKDRCNRLRDIAKGFHEACKDGVQATASEDDFVNLFFTMLKVMAPDNIVVHSKVDWKEELKPMPRKSKWDLSVFVNSTAMKRDEQQDVKSASVYPPPKWQQQSAGQTSIPATPDRPIQVDPMPPSTSGHLPRRMKKTFPIKTPRLDISVGIKETALVSKLSAVSSQNLSGDEAKEFLDELEDTMEWNKPAGREGPLLVAAPAQLATNLVFPFAVVECKAYSTGKQVFEAQNQAAVSGAWGLRYSFL